MRCFFSVLLPLSLISRLLSAACRIRNKRWGVSVPRMRRTSSVWPSGSRP